MATVEADAVVIPLLKRMADEAGVVYSMAYGDQPALIVELYDWAISAGFEVVAAGKGNNHEWRYGTPDDSLERLGFSQRQIKHLIALFQSRDGAKVSRGIPKAGEASSG